MSAISYESQVQKWQPGGGNDRRFTVISIAVVIVLLSSGIFLSSIELQKEERKARAVVPERVAQFILEKEKPKPKPKPKPITKPKPKLEAKVKSEPKPKPKTQLKPTKIKNKTPLTDKQKTAREKAEKSGLLALSNELADLMDNTPDVTAMVGAKINQTSDSGKIAKVDTNILAFATTTTDAESRVRIENNPAVISTTRLNEQERIEVAQTLMAEVNDEPAMSASGEQKSPVKKSQSGRSSINSRSEEDIAYVMDKNKGKLHSVYRRARRANAGIKGKIVFTITILPSGQVSTVVISSSELNDTKLESRLVARVKSFDFGVREGDSITVTYPVEFLPS